MAIFRRFPASHRSRLLLILAASCSLQLVLLLFSAGAKLEGDAPHYDELGWSIAQGRGLSEADGRATALRPPFYPLFIGAVYRVFGHNPDAVRLAQILVGLLTVLVTYLLVKDLFKENAAIFAAGIVAFYPELVGIRMVLWSETLFVFWVLFAFWAILRFARSLRWQALAVAGLAIGMSVWTRPSAVVLLPAAIVLLFIKLRANRTQFVRQAATLAAIVIVLMSPWIIRNYMLFGQIVLGDTYLGQAYYTGHASYTPLLSGWRAMDHFLEDPIYLEIKAKATTEIEMSNALFQVAFQNVKEQPVLAVARSFGKVVDFWGPERFVAGQVSAGAFGEPSWALVVVAGLITNIGYLILLVLGFIGLRAARSGTEKSLFFSFVVLYVLEFALSYGGPRYRVPLVPLIAIYAGYALAQRPLSGESWARTWRWGRRVRVAGPEV